IADPDLCARLQHAPVSQLAVESSSSINLNSPSIRTAINPAFSLLHPSPFEKLRPLMAGAQPPEDRPRIAPSSGAPKHSAPAFVAGTLAAHSDQLSVYPATLGAPALREAIVAWCQRRFGVPAGWLDPARHALPVGGTREALFSFVQAAFNRERGGLVV